MPRESRRWRAAANAAVNSQGQAQEFPQGEFISPEEAK